MRAALLHMMVWIGVAVCALGPDLWLGDQMVPGGPWTDVWNSLWSMNFAHESFSNGQFPWHTDALGHPGGGTVLLPDLWGALFAGLAVPLLGLTATYTAWMVLQLALGGLVAQGFCTEWLCASGLERPESVRAGWVAGLAYTTAPVYLAGATCGTTEAVASAWPALAAWMAWRAHNDTNWRTIGIGAVSLFAAAVASWYAAVIATAFVGVFTAMALPKKGVWVAMPLLAGLGLILPFALWTHGVHADPTHLATRNPEILNNIRASFGAASPMGMLWPTDAADIAIPSAKEAGLGYLHTGYIGLTLLSASVVGIIRRPKATAAVAIAGCVCATLALGPGSDDWLPYGLVNDWPGFSSLSLVWRLSGGAALAAALLAAAATQGRTPAVIALSLGIVLETALFAPTAGGVAVSSVAPTATLELLAKQPAGAVITLPSGENHPDLWRQTQHGQPVTSNINIRRSPAASQWIHSARDTEWDVMVQMAQKQGFRYVLVHQSKSLRTGGDRFLAAKLQNNSQGIGQDGRWTFFVLW
ncbi:MAG: hypothetical protein H8D71_02220 [Deltaproteobacteria bacterium]|nr:hypothetical protein [Deltaproteobacteria bacterium]